MRPGLAREIVRNGTAYSAGRSLANALVVGYIGGLLVLAVWWVAEHGWPNSPAAVVDCVVPFLVVLVGGAIAVFIRELAHAVFDMADVALKRPDPER